MKRPLPIPKVIALLEATRQAAEVTQTDIATAVGLTQSSWSKAKRGGPVILTEAQEEQARHQCRALMAELMEAI